MESNHRPPGYEPGELTNCSTPQSAQRELNSHLLHGKQMGYHYTMGAIHVIFPCCQLHLKDSKRQFQVHNNPYSIRIVVTVAITVSLRLTSRFAVGVEGIEPSTFVL